MRYPVLAVCMAVIVIAAAHAGPEATTPTARKDGDRSEGIDRVFDWFVGRLADRLADHLAAETGEARTSTPWKEEYRSQVIGLLLDALLDLEGGGAEGETELHRSAAGGQRGEVGLLLAKGVDVNTRDRRGFTPLHWAAGLGHLPVVKLLLANGADADATVKGETTPELHLTPLQLAAARGHTEVVRELIGAGADLSASFVLLDEPYVGGSFFSASSLVVTWSPLELAYLEGHPDTVELLLSKGADVNAGGQDGETVLHAAVRAGDGDMVERLLARGADANARALTTGDTPLHLAAWSAHKEVVGLLLAAGADVGLKNVGFPVRDPLRAGEEATYYGAEVTAQRDTLQILRGAAAKVAAEKKRVVRDGARAEVTRHDTTFEIAFFKWGAWKYMKSELDLLDEVTLYADGKGRVWVGIYPDFFDGKEWHVAGPAYLAAGRSERSRRPVRASNIASLSWRRLGPQLGGPSADVFAMEEDEKGDLWVSTVSGLYRFDGAKWVEIPVPWEVTRGILWPILRGPPGEFVFGTSGGGVVSLRGDEWTTIFEETSPYSPRPWWDELFSHSQQFTMTNLVASDGKGTVWYDRPLAGVEGLPVLRYTGSEWEEFPLSEGVKQRRSGFLHYDGYRDRLLVGLRGSGTYSLEGGLVAVSREGKKLVEYSPEIKYGEVIGAHVDNAGDIWLRTAWGGFAHLEGNVYRRFPLYIGEHEYDRPILGLTGDGKGNVWVATEDGLFRIRRKPVEAEP